VDFIATMFTMGWATGFQKLFTPGCIRKSGIEFWPNYYSDRKPNTFYPSHEKFGLVCAIALDVIISFGSFRMCLHDLSRLVVKNIK